VRSNKAQGNLSERMFVQVLRAHGFWAHKLVENENGAPFDIIAVRGGIAYAFEVKEVSNGTRFHLSRVEENQIAAAKVWASKGNSRHYFAFRLARCGQWVFWRAEDILSELASGARSIDVLEQGVCLSAEVVFS
jgi:Holliday junction resolvase